MNICVVIHVFNSPYILEIIEDILSFDYKLIVVDDGSDIKVEYLNDNVEILRHKINEGKGQAILTGAKRARELGFDSFITIDADKQHLSSEIVKLINAYEKEAIVIGNRNFDSKNVPESSKIGRKFSNFWVNLETGQNFGDTQSGFRIYPVSILELKTINKRFDFEIEVLVLHSYRKGKIIDIEVECYYPPKNERISHFDKVKDNARLSLLHSKLMMQRFFLLRGFLWS